MQASESEWQIALHFARQHAGVGWQVASDAVRIGRSDCLDKAGQEELQKILLSMRPFRKGPFEIFGQRIDANWKSDRKWERLANFLPDLKDAAVCDIGCNNGYFMYRLHEWARPAGLKEIVGLDPQWRNYNYFSFFNTMAACPDIEFLQEGFDWLAGQTNRFDLILCLGILYHHTDPIQILRLAHAALKKGGQLIVESLGIPQKAGANCLIPAGRYAGMRGVWQVPDQSALLAWLKRSGLQKSEILLEHPYQDEQVRTEWGDLPALAECLDAGNPGLTREGYPAPVRIWGRGYK